MIEGFTDKWRRGRIDSFLSRIPSCPYSLWKRPRLFCSFKVTELARRIPTGIQLQSAETAATTEQRRVVKEKLTTSKSMTKLMSAETDETTASITEAVVKITAGAEKRTTERTAHAIHEDTKTQIISDTKIGKLTEASADLNHEKQGAVRRKVPDISVKRKRKGNYELFGQISGTNPPGGIIQ